LPVVLETPRVQRIVCYITDRKSFQHADPIDTLLARIRAAILAGLDWVQVREKYLPTAELMSLVRAAVDMPRDGARKARVIVNDRLDVALAAGAHGVHLGGESAPARDVVRWCRAGNAPAEFLVGVSCHRLDEVQEAADAGASYAFFGPVFETPAKKSFGAPQGIDRLREACRAARVPVVAVGGVDAENAEECLRAGAGGIAAIRLFQERRDPESLGALVDRLHSFAP
jgi:thiamine-phosphate pyrophosphorylase